LYKSSKIEPLKKEGNEMEQGIRGFGYHEFKLADVMRTAHRHIAHNLAVKQGEQIAIIADYDTDFLVVDAFAAAARALEAEPSIIIIPPREKAGMPPNKVVIEALKGADVGISPASTSFVHIPEIRSLWENGKFRYSTAPALTTEMMVKGAATADYEEVNRITQKLAKVLEGGKTLRLTTEEGTDLHADMEGMPIVPCAGLAKSPGDHACYPDGEAAQAPRPGTAEGVIVFNVSMHMLGLINEPIRLTVERGRAINIEGGKEAMQLKEIIKGVENADNIGEISIATNPKALIIGNISEDKRGYGRVHIALGSGFAYGQGIRSPLHLDGVLLNPKYELDGKVIVENGELNIE
jgi:leucyl aminopeptidase (aminopeptidase T)